MIATQDLTRVPEWIPAEMPPGYRTRQLEIERLSAEMRAMENIGRVLWQTGEPLRDAVAVLFAEMKGDVEAPRGSAGPLGVRVGTARRLLVLVADAPGPIHRAHGELTRAFQAVQFADPDDRVLFVAQGDVEAPPAGRGDPVMPEARELLERMGVEVTDTVSLFKLWRLWLEDQQKARKALERFA